jgi:hypothetical protein
VEKLDHGLRHIDRILDLLARDARAYVNDAVTALRVGLIFMPPLAVYSPSDLTGGLGEAQRPISKI